MPKFLVTTYKGLDAQKREVITAPHLAKARAQVVARYPQATARRIGTPRPQFDEFGLKFQDERQEFEHLTVSFTIHREDTAPFEVYAPQTS